MSKELEALEEIRDFRYGEDKLLVCQTEMYGVIKSALQRLESIDNANPSEALECLELIGGAYLLRDDETVAEGFKEEFATVKQALLKQEELEKENQELLQAVVLFKQKLEDTDNIKVATLMMKQLDKIVSLENENKVLKEQQQRESKHYLKWDDLDFKEETQEMFVLLNGSCYLLEYYNDSEEDFVFIRATHTTVFELDGNSEDDKQFFNDLHLERVEENERF